MGNKTHLSVFFMRDERSPLLRQSFSNNTSMILVGELTCGS